MFVTIYVKHIIFLNIIFCLLLVNSKEIKTKEEVLKLKNQYYVSYYCKDDICVDSPYDYSDSYIEIPDKNGNVTKYITYTCTYDNINSGSCFNETRFLCNSDLECLSDKCYKNHCMFNEEIPIVHCDDIYSHPLFFGKKSYMYCGKPYRDTCKSNNECSSKICTSRGTCNLQPNGPSDSDGIQTGIEVFIIIFIIIVILAIGCRCYKIKKSKTIL